MNTSMEFETRSDRRRQSYFQKRPERLWGPTSLHFNEHRGSFPGAKGRRVMVTIQLYVEPSLKMSAAKSLLPLRAFITWY